MRFTKMIRKYLVFLAFLSLLIWSCRREERFVQTNVQLEYSADTVFLDTVFEQIGSSTYQLKVYNRGAEDARVPNIRLANPNSPFQLNINGIASNNQSDVQILAEDSIYIFIEVQPEAVNTGSELLLNDQIIFDLGGKEESVELISLALDAIFHKPTNFLVLGEGNNSVLIPYSIINCNSSWDASKPHVVYGYAVVDSGCTLDILAGVDVHFHENSGLWVFEGGQLNIAQGNFPGSGDSVTFSSDRLEPFYEDIPGQWGGVLGGLYIGQGAKAKINNLVLKNAVNGLRVDSARFTDQLEITNSYILNCSRTAIYAGYSHIKAYNLVVANCGLYGLYAFGGNYEFRHSTFANFWSQSTRQEPMVLLTNFFDFQNESGQIQRIARDLESAYFGNCIISGIGNQELGLAEDENALFNYQFEHALLKLDNDLEDRGFDVNDARFNNVLVNVDPDFVRPEDNLFALDSASQVIDLGNTADGFVVPSDILGRNRNFNGLPDLGAYERQF